jgi:hypothetical protein
MNAVPEYSFVFVCQQGELEIKAMLLAASLHRFVTAAYEMVAAVPHPADRYGALARGTVGMLEGLNVRLAPITNSVDPTYPIANKISAMAISTRGRRRIFLDSDIMCTRELSIEPRLDVPFGAAPAAGLTWGQQLDNWHRAYALFGLTTPDLRIRTLRTREETPPYYNAGFIVAGGEVADAFAAAWLECCLVIDRERSIPDKRPWLDQIALPIAVTRLGLPHHFLDETFNHPGDARVLPQFCHYHAPLRAKRLPVVKALVREMVERHPALRERVLKDRLWSDVLSDRFGILDAMHALKTARRWIAPPGSRRDDAVSGLARRVRMVLSSGKGLR